MDIVIPVKESYINEELRYCLRSISENFPHNLLWLSGYKPPWLTGPVNFIETPKPPGDKYIKVVMNNIRACKHPGTSENFYLFNDDFFVMKPVERFENYHRESIDDSIKRLEGVTTGSIYLKSLKFTKEILEKMGIKNPMDYGLHIPMIINKKNWLEAYRAQLKLNPDREVVHMRTIYGNMFQVAKQQMSDVKILDIETVPTGNETFLSTDDSAFTQGKVGEHIRERFPNPCEYEGAIANTFVLK